MINLKLGTKITSLLANKIISNYIKKKYGIRPSITINDFSVNELGDETILKLSVEIKAKNSDIEKMFNSI